MLEAPAEPGATKATRAFVPHELALPMGVALVLRLALVACVRVVPRWDGVIYTRAAQDLAEGRGFTRAIFTPGPEQPLTAFYPVGFPAWLAALRLLHIEGRGALVLQALLGTLIVPLAWHLAKRLSNVESARAAAWLAALWPGGVIYTLTYFSEPLFALFLGIATLILMSRAGQGGWRAACLAGLALGCAAWVRPTALALAFALGAAHGRTWRERALAALLTSLVALAVVSPWMVRNAAFLEGPTLSTNGSYNLLLGTYGLGGYADLPVGADCALSLEASDLDHCRTDRALARIEAAPLTWCLRGLHKLADTFTHESTPGLYLKTAIDGATPRERDWAWAIATALSAPFWGALFLLAVSAPFLRRCARAPLHIVLAPVLMLACIHFVYIGGDRYHVAVAPMMFALAGVAFSKLREGFKPPPTQATDSAPLR